MNRSLFTDLRREIRRSLTRYCSILLMIALGCMFFVGLRSAAPDMRASADDFCDRQQLFDLQLLSSYGLTPEDAETFSALEGVGICEGGWVLDAILGKGEEQKVVKLLNAGGAINRPVLLSGRLPENPDECALDDKLLKVFALSLGDRVTLDTSAADSLACREFTVTGIVQSPLYLSIDRGNSSIGDGSVAGFVLLPEEAFVLNYYTVVYLTGTGTTALDAYGAAYRAKVEDLRQRAEVLLQDRAELRFTKLYSEGKQKLDEGEAEYAARKEEAEAEIAAAEAELAEAAADLAAGREAYTASRAEVETARDEGADALAKNREALDAGAAALAEALLQLRTAEAAYQLNAAQAERSQTAAEAALKARAAALDEAGLALAQRQNDLETMRLEAAAYARALAFQQEQLAAAQAAGLEIAPEDLPLSEEGLAALQTAYEAAKAETEATLASLTAQREALLQEQMALTGSRLESAVALGAARSELDKNWAAYNEKKAELEAGEAAWAEAEAAYQAAIAEAEPQLEEAEAALIEGQRQYDEGFRALVDAKLTLQTSLEEARAELDAGARELARLERPEIYALDRNSNYGFVSYDQNAERMARLAKLFPVIFFLVAALVCLTTMTRMVEEERTQIGSIKALGYGTWAIAGKFLFYGLSAALLGALLGGTAGSVIIPQVIFSSYSIMYILPKLKIAFYWKLWLLAGGAGLICTLAATLGAVFSTARQTPAALMRPKAPKPGKRILLEHITPLWRRMSFSLKVSARNLFRYKKRMFMTVIGVAGCTGMLIAGLGLHSSIFDILDVQFFDLYRYDVQVTVDPEEPGVAAAVTRLLEGEALVESWTGLSTRSVTFSAKGSSVDGYLSVVPDPEALSEQIILRDMDTKERLDLPENGALIDVKLAELLGLEVGDTITLDAGTRLQLKVGGIREHYVYHYATVTGAYYSRLTGETVPDNEYLISVSDDSEAAVSALCEKLMALEGVRSASNMNAMAASFRKTMEVVDAAVMVIILSAAALAFVVLYNLTNINVTERLRELATLKVLGFRDVEVGMYVYRENIVLTILGIALGQLFGKYLCTFLVRTIEMDIVMFGRDARLQNYLLSVGLTLVFAVLVNFFMYFRIKRIDMVQSLKSVED